MLNEEPTEELVSMASGTEVTIVSPVAPLVDATSAPRLPMIAEGKQRRFSDETEDLLRRRLTFAAIDLTIVLGIGYVGNWLAGSSQWLLLRTLILVAIVASLFLLRSRVPMRIGALRSLEAVLFGGVALQMALMMYSRSVFFIQANEPASLVGVQQFFFTAFCLHILTYGIFMPNQWRRAAVIMTILALIPYLVLALLRYHLPEIAELEKLNRGTAPLPTTLIAALIGTLGSHIIHRTRREAFQAKQIMQYRLHEKIGSGGMGDVYKAEHLLLKRRCAMKLIHPEKGQDATTLKRFEREVVATARLSHWNTIDIYDYGHTEDGTFYYVMELLEGDNLQNLVRDHGPMSVERTIYLLAQACDALYEAHQNGLIHRDIKPANIFASHRGGNWDVCKILDFGLVKETTEQSTDLVKQGSFSGTPLYMSPEQATRYETVDARSDIYSLGCVAYFLLTGRPPFQGKSTIELIAAHATETPIPPSKLGNHSNPEMDDVVLKCLEKHPEDRFATTAEMAKRLRDIRVERPWTAQTAEAWWADQSSVRKA